MIHSNLIPNAQFNDSDDLENIDDLEIASMEQSHSDVSLQLPLLALIKDGLITKKKNLLSC